MTQKKRVTDKINLVLFVVALLGGFIIYAPGHLSSALNPEDAALRGIFSTSRMFLLSADYEILSHGNLLRQSIFWLSHMSALFLFHAAVFTFFGQRLREKFLLACGLHSEVYLIKGSDKYALMLGENIATGDKPQNSPNKERLVVFLLDEGDDSEKIEKKIAHFGGIVRILDRKCNLQHYLKKVGLNRWTLFKRAYNVIFMPNCTSAPADAFSIAEYAADVKGKKKKDLDIFVFVSSEWAREQLESSIHGHKYPCVFHIINETNLLTSRMVEMHRPFECCGLEFELGKAKRNFNVMVLGFGTVGEHALLRLIMNGQFVTVNNKPMHAIVVDREKKHVEEHFLHSYPSLMEHCCKIKFLDYDVRSKVFFDLLKNVSSDNDTIEIINNLDYIVIALNSDEENKKVARDIRLLYKRNMKSGAAPIIAVSAKKEGMHNYEHGDGIFTFGCREEIYKHAVIIREETNRMAKAVHKVYGNYPSWEKLEWFLQESNRASADFIDTMLYLSNYPKKQGGNLSKGVICTLNSKEQRELARSDTSKEMRLTNDKNLAEILAQTEHLRWNAFHAAMGYRPIRIEEMQQRFKDYNGNGDILDYSRKCSKDRIQVCLTSWENLENVTREYVKLANEAVNNLTKKLVARGVLEDEIKIIHDANNKAGDEEENKRRAIKYENLKETICKRIGLKDEEGKKELRSEIDLLKKYIKEQKRDFKGNDRGIIESIPEFLKEAETFVVK